MDILDLMKERHSVRSYKEDKIKDVDREKLSQIVDDCNIESGLNIQLCFDEPKAFKSMLAHYGNFNNVKNYIAIVGKPNETEKCGYFGEKIVLKAQEIGLNTCWVVLTYSKSKAVYQKDKKQSLLAVIALGHGVTNGVRSHSKSIEELLEVVGDKPDYLDRGVEACMLAPTAMHQQKFKIKSIDGKVSIDVNGIGFYTKMDLGIVKYHFEAATGVKIN